jgi:hypothetical protein
MGSFGQIFSKDTQAIFYNWKANPVQRMLDFDFLCGDASTQKSIGLLFSDGRPLWASKPLPASNVLIMIVFRPVFILEVYQNLECELRKCGWC